MYHLRWPVAKKKLPTGINQHWWHFGIAVAVNETEAGCSNEEENIDDSDIDEEIENTTDFDLMEILKKLPTGLHQQWWHFGIAVAVNETAL